MVICIDGCSSQVISYVPGSSNVTPTDLFGSRFSSTIGSSTACPPVPSVTVCAKLSAFRNLTVVPTAMVSSSGSKFDDSSLTRSSSAVAASNSAAASDSAGAADSAACDSGGSGSDAVASGASASVGDAALLLHAASASASRASSTGSGRDRLMRALLLCGNGSIAAYTMPVTYRRAHLTPIGAARIVLGPTPFAPRVEHAAGHDLRVAPLTWGTRHPTPGRRHRRPCPPLRGGPGAGWRFAADRRRPDHRPAGQQRGRKDDAAASA